MSATPVVKRVEQVAEAVLIALLMLLMIGCEVGPDYKSPAGNVPSHYRQALLATSERPMKATLAAG